MRLKRKLLMIIGIALVAIGSILGTYFTLLATGTVASTSSGREITIQVDDEEKYYDNSTLYPTSYTPLVEDLRSGDTLKLLEYTGSQTNAGESESYATFAVIDSSGYDVTSDYKITVIPGKLKVNKRPLTLATKAESKEFDGTPLTGSLFEIKTGNLAEGQQIAADFTSSISDVGMTESVMTASIFDYFGNNVTDNYEITYSNGMLEITQATIVLRTLTESHVYDGTYFEGNESVMEGTLPEGYTISYDYTDASLIDTVGEVASEILYSSIKIMNADGKVVFNGAAPSKSSDFAVSVQNVGKLVVTPYTLIGTHEDYTVTYDGKYHQNTSIRLKDASMNSIAVNNNTFSLFDKTYKMDFSTSTKLLNAGSVINEITPRIYDGDKDVTDSFDLSVNSALLTVEKKELSIYGVSEEKVYNGEELSLVSSTEYDTDKTEGLVSGDSLTVKYKYSAHITDVGSVDSEILNVTIKHTADDDYKGADMYNNYFVKLYSGELKVTPIYLTIQGCNTSFEYDGAAHTPYDGAEHTLSETFEKTGDSDVETNESVVDQNGDDIDLDSFGTIIIVYTSKITDYAASDQKNEFYVKSVVKNGKDLTANCEITCMPGYATVTKRTIKITASDITKTFDCTDVTPDDVKYTSDTRLDSTYQLVAGHKISVSYDESDVFTVAEQIKSTTLEESIILFNKNTNKYIIHDTNGFDVTSNYEIDENSTEKVKITISKRNVTIVGEDKTQDYNEDDELNILATNGTDTSKDKFYFNYSVSTASLLPDNVYFRLAAQKIVSDTDNKNTMQKTTKSGVITYYISDVDESFSLSILKGVILYCYVDGVETEVNGLFNISTINPQFNITPITVNITIPSSTISYGSEFTPKDITYAGETITTKCDYSQGDDAGSYEITVKRNNLEDTGNYNCNVTNGVLTVLKKSVSVVVPSSSITYGDEFTPGSITAEGKTITLDCSYRSDDPAGQYEITADASELEDDDNYSVSVTNGTLTVNKKQISIVVPNETISYKDEYTPEDMTVEDKTVYLSCSYITGANAGKYAIEADTREFDSSNYSVSVTNGVLTVSKKQISIIIPNETIIYNDEYSAGTLTVDDLTIHLSCSYTKGDAVGKYSITADNLYEYEENYSLSVTNGYLVVSKKQVTIVVPNETVTYMDDFAPGTLTVEDKTVGLLCSYTAGDDAGKYAIEANTSAFDDNYSLSVTNGVLIVSKKAISFTIPSDSITYGDSYDAGTMTVDGKVVTLSTSYTAGNDVGKYTITSNASSVFDADNYSITVINGTLTVNKKNVTITAPNASITTGTAYTPVAITVDSETVYTTASGYSTTSPAGTYVISVDTTSIEDNYNVTVINGTLTVSD